MAKQQYFVVCHDGRWTVSYEGRHAVVYATQPEAIRAAINLAQAAGLGGHDAQVFVQGSNDQFRMEWTYGHDPYPPRGVSSRSGTSDG